MRYFQILAALCITLATHLSGQTIKASAEVKDGAFSFSSSTTENGWVEVTADIHGNQAAFQLPTLEAWSYNTLHKQLEFVASAEDPDTFVAIAIQPVSEETEWESLVKKNEEWFCTCGGQECDCELIKFTHSQGMLSIDGKTVTRLDEVIWDKDEVKDKKTGESKFEGPICKTTMILSGSQFYLVMSRYKGSDEERQPELEATHDRIADSIADAYPEEFRLLRLSK